jgi:hypothetical protein
MKTLYTALALLALATTDAQGIYMLNGRATPSVIVGGGGEIYPVIPGPQFAGPSPVLLAPPVPWLRARVGPYAPIVPDPPREPRSVAPAPPPAAPSPPAVPHGYITCAIAEGCLGNDRKWTSSVRGTRGLRSTPPRPVPGAPFERNPDDRRD